MDPRLRTPGLVCYCATNITTNPAVVYMSWPGVLSLYWQSPLSVHLQLEEDIMELCFLAAASHSNYALSTLPLLDSGRLPALLGQKSIDAHSSTKSRAKLEIYQFSLNYTEEVLYYGNKKKSTYLSVFFKIY